MKICSFTGHRKIKSLSMEEIESRLDIIIEKLIKMGVHTFCSGGALGFDQICAEIVLKKKEIYNNIKLVFVLPCKNQDKLWSYEQKDFYKKLVSKADNVIYVSENYTYECMKLRNKKLIEMADVCICALKTQRTGTAQTVRMAEEKRIKIINIL